MAVLTFTRISKNVPALMSTMSNTFCTVRNPVASSVDEHEIANFKKLSSEWWDTMSTSPLYALNQLRVPFIRDGLINTGVAKPENINTHQPLKGLSILDVGCGGGFLTEALARLGCNITGLDASTDQIQVAREHAALDPTLTNLVYEFSTVEKHVQNNIEKYDAVVSSEVIEHITEKNVFLEACVKGLKCGGSIFITTLNKTTASWFAGIICAEYVLRLIPKGTHEWEKFIAPHQLQRMLEDYNCRTTVVHGMMYNHLTNKWCWTSYDTINYALQAVKN